MNEQSAKGRNEPLSEGDRYARKSFTWRRMEPRRIWQILLALAVFILLGWLYL
jgi:hypothetical protein